MNSKQHGDTEGCERNFEYNGDDDDLDEYVLSIIENISKEELQQTLLNTNEERQKKAKTHTNQYSCLTLTILLSFFE
ncbi:hypothetical protein ACOSQ3_016341 [Xanthoceras sorbifolium]